MPLKLLCSERFKKTETRAKPSLARVSQDSSVAIRGERGSYNRANRIQFHQ